MTFNSRSSFGAHLKAILVSLGLLWMSVNAAQEFQCPSGFFIFGTSTSDTGNVVFAFPGTQQSESLPYGETFFGFNALRYSNGRLVVDFLDLAFGYPLGSAYLLSAAPEFRHGANFAASRATALPESTLVPFYLGVQVRQFSRFKQNTEEAEHARGVPFETKTFFPKKSLFIDGLYFLSFGRNDLTIAYTVQGYTPATASTTVVPKIVSSIVDGIQSLYKDGARNFLVFNLSPGGCLPQYLTFFGSSANQTDFDKYGCLASYNQVEQVFNSQLKTAVDGLRANLSGSLFLLFDYYQVNIDVLQNPESYGFLSKNVLKACCGVGGKYNYNEKVNCTETGTVNNVTVTVGSCSQPSEYISWDGVHTTDAFNEVLARELLSGKYLDPPINLTASCHLDLSKFSAATFHEAYPHGYIIAP